MLLAALLVVTVAWADVFLMDVVGYDWFWIAAPGEPGSCYGALGEVVSVNPTYLTFDYGANEYTFNWDFSCYVSGDTLGGVYAIYLYDGSTSSFEVYCDSKTTGTTADYGSNPPNVQQATFTDGELVLSGSWVGDIQIVVNLFTGEGTVEGEILWDGGTQLSNIPVPQRSQSMSLNGVKYDPPAGPVGYHWQIDGNVFLPDPVPVEDTSWGLIKSRFHEGSN
jgi:hypothetical protein